MQSESWDRVHKVVVELGAASPKAARTLNTRIRNAGHGSVLQAKKLVDGECDPTHARLINLRPHYRGITLLRDLLCGASALPKAPRRRRSTGAILTSGAFWLRHCVALRTATSAGFVDSGDRTAL